MTATSRKAITAVVGAALVALYAALNGDNRVGTEEAIQIAIAAFTAFQVWLTANVASSRYAKALTAGALAVLAGLVGYITDGIDRTELVSLVIMGLTAAGVLAVPNVARLGSARSSS